MVAFKILMLTNLKITQKGQWVNLYHRLVTITLQWILAAKLSQKFCSGCTVTWFLRKFSGTWPYRAIVLRIPIFFRLQLEVAIELLSGIKMFLISMVALKMLIPQKFWNCPNGQNLRSYCRNSAVAIWPLAIVVFAEVIRWSHRATYCTANPFFFFRQQRWP